MKRSLAAFLTGLILASQAAAQAPSPAQLGITPTTNPEALQVLDSTKTWVPLGGVDPINHVFIPVGGGGGGGGGVGEADILVTDPTVGMVAGGADNSPHLSALMNKMSAGTGAYQGYDVLFPGIPGQKGVVYYFTQPFVNSRVANYHCAGSAWFPSVSLVFAPGVDGFIDEAPANNPDGGTGGGIISGCAIYSLGYGQATVDPHSPNTLNAVSFSSVAGTPTTTWNVGDGIILTPFANSVQPTSAIIAAPIGTTIASVGSGTVTLSGTGVVQTIGQSNTPPLATATFTETGTNNFVNNDVFQLGPTTYTFQTAAIGTATAPNHVLIGATFDASVANLVAAINGGLGEFNTYAPNNTGENAYIYDASVSAASTPSSGVITFSARYSGLDTNSFPSVYTAAGTAAGSFGGATFSGANTVAQNVRFYQLPGPNAPSPQVFKVQTTIGSNVVTVISGPRLLHGGDVIWSDAFPFGSTLYAVTGTLGAQTLHVTGPTNTSGAQNATVTHAPGAEGNLWIMPAGLTHRITGTSAEHLVIDFFPIGESLACSSAGGVNCDLSRDEDIYHAFNLVGRWVSGNNTSTSSSINEQFAHDFLTDIFEGGTLGEVYLNPNMSSVEAGNAKFPALKNCANENYSVIFGSYSFGGYSGCANATAVLPPSYGGLMIFGTLSGGFNGAPSYRNGGGGTGGGFGNGLTITGGPDGVHSVCMLTSPTYYDIAFSYNGCATGQTWGIIWNSSGGYWSFAQNVNEAMRLLYPGGGYTGYTAYNGLAVGFMSGAIFGGEQQSSNYSRLISSSPAKPIGALNHANGDVDFNVRPVSGGTAAWVDASIFSTTLTAALAKGVPNATVAVAACPTASIAASLYVSDEGPSAASPPKYLGVYSSCTGGVLTFTAAATLNAGASGDTVKILQWMPAMAVSNDTTNPDFTMTTIRSGSAANKDITGRVTLAGGTATYTLAGIYATPPVCLTADATTPANASSVSESTTVLTFTGTGTDVIKYECVGRN